MNPLFSINMYDSDGDVTEEGIFIWLGEYPHRTVLKFENIKHLEVFANQIDDVIFEIKRDYL